MKYSIRYRLRLAWWALTNLDKLTAWGIRQARMKEFFDAITAGQTRFYGLDRPRHRGGGEDE